MPFHRLMGCRVFFIATLCSLVSIARAAETFTHTYKGDNYTDTGGGPYTTSMSISGSFAFACPLTSNLTNFNALPNIISFTLTDVV